MMILISIVLLCASGIQGELLRVYKDIDFKGQSEDIIQNTESFALEPDWDDQISSVDAILGTWRLFEQSDYKGESMLVCSGRKYSRVDTNDAYSSMKLVSDKGCGVLRVYKDIDFKGQSEDIIQSTASFALEPDWNDQISSVDAILGTWRLFEQRDYKGESMLVCSGRKYSKVDANDAYTSMKLVSDTECGGKGKLRVYTDFGFRGQSKEMSESTSLVGSDWDDQISSVYAISGNWMLFTNSNYTGESILVCSGRKYPSFIANDAYSSMRLLQGKVKGCYARGGRRG